MAEASDPEHRRTQPNVNPQLARARAHRRRSEGDTGEITSVHCTCSEGGGSAQWARAGADRRKSEGSADTREPLPPSPSQSSLLRRRSSRGGSSPRQPLSPPPSPPTQLPVEARAPEEVLLTVDCYALLLILCYAYHFSCFLLFHRPLLLTTPHYYTHLPNTTC